MRLLRTIPVAAAAMLLAACAGSSPGETPEYVEPQSSLAANTSNVDTANRTAVVPQIAAQPVHMVEKVFPPAGLVPILRYEPGVVTAPGTVVSTYPPAGTTMAWGDVVTVIVAGLPGPTLADYVDAHRETFVGLGTDSHGVLVIAVYQKANLATEMATVSTLTKGKVTRVQNCARSWAELRRVQLELNQREFVPGADRLAFASAIDPLACAVRLTIDLADEQIAALSTKFEGALVIQKGEAGRLVNG